jgi:ribosome biogenesis GTPase
LEVTVKTSNTLKSSDSFGHPLAPSHNNRDSLLQNQPDNNDQTQIPGRVIGGRRNSFLVKHAHGETLATIAGSLFNDPNTDYPAVGDWVLLRDSVIIEVLPRINALARQAAGGRNRRSNAILSSDQVIATNLDTTFIVCGLDRDFNLRRIERYLTLVYNCGINPVVILTKADLHQTPESFVSEVATVALGVPTHLVSANDNQSLDPLEEYLSPGKTVALLGSSGSGKSTLINRLYGEEIRATNSISKRVGKGRHTTTTRDLIVLPSGGMVIDNPGIREIAFGVDHSLVESAFPDIEDLSTLCKFPDCSHTHEPGCMVLEAVFTGKLSRERLTSFLKIKGELQFLSHRETKGAARVEKERWKGISQKQKAFKKRGKQ